MILVALQWILKNWHLATLGLCVSVIIAFYARNMHLSDEMDQYKANEDKYEISLELQKKTIEKQKLDIAEIRRIQSNIEQLNNNLLTDVNNLQTKLSKGGRSISKLANKKPTLIQNKINNSTMNAIRCLEIATGSKLTEEELNDNKNNECASIINHAKSID